MTEADHPNSLIYDETVADLNREMQRQNILHPYQCTNSSAIWTVVLAEEVGEVAQEVLNARSLDDLYREVMHVTAVGIQWMQALQARRKTHERSN